LKPFLSGGIFVLLTFFVFSVHLIIFQSCNRKNDPEITITTSEISGESYTSVVSGGTIECNGDLKVLSRGVCWNNKGDPTINDNYTTDSSGCGTFVSVISGLLPSTSMNIQFYTARAYAKTQKGIEYGNVVSFHTAVSNLPKVITLIPTSITENSALSGGNVINEGSFPVTARGVRWSTQYGIWIKYDGYTTDGSGMGSFESKVTGLEPNTKYYIMAYATNLGGDGYGDELSFTTSNIIIATTPPSAVTSTSASSGGTIRSDFTEPVLDRGICWNTMPNPTIADLKTSDGSGTGSYSSNMTGLIPNTIYYVRAYVVTNQGTLYGDQIILKTMTGLIADVDGNVYKTVTIGTQIWMAENLRTTRYNDGTIISKASSSSYNQPNYDLYMSENANIEKYGFLYNFYVVMTNKLCPVGWHVPTDAEWTGLTDYLGGEKVAGGKMKEAGFLHWESPNTAATNESGFGGLPGGYSARQEESVPMAHYPYGGLGETGSWYTSTEFNSYYAWSRNINSSSQEVVRPYGKYSFGLSVRCIKD
jgi:uncharacterized protein (TIGR02145 family)